MVDKVLVVTPYSSLGKLISQSLEQSGAYQVQVTESADKALELCAQSHFSIAILDADVPDQTIVTLGQGLNLTYPDLPLVVIPPNNDPHSPLLTGLSPKAFLSKPFYLPDLLKTIQGLVSGEEKPSDLLPLKTGSLLSKFINEPDTPPWYEDPSQVLDRLTHISLGPGIHEAIITYTNEMWAYTGQLSVEAAQEISGTTIHFWNSGENGDLARFVRLKSNGQQYFLYATHLSGNLVLTLIYDSNMPFSRIRYQTSQLARSLATSESTNPTESQPPSSSVNPLLSGAESLEGATALESQTSSLSDSLTSADSAVQSSQEKKNEITTESSDGKVEVTTPGSNQAGEGTKPGVQSTSINQGVSPENKEEKIKQETHGFSTQIEGELEPVISGLSNLTYMVALIPRLPHHNLTGDLATCLNQWMPQLCLAFGWKLAKLVVLSDHIEWIVRLPPDISPVKMLDVVCQHTSQRIFTRFPNLAQENPSGDFWAPGFLIANGPGGLMADKLGDYIAQMRKQQTMAEY